MAMSQFKERQNSERTFPILSISIATD